MKRILSFLILIFVAMACLAIEPDIIFLEDGQSIKAYNLDITSENVYYTLSEDPNNQVQKVSIAGVLIIKKADGTKIDPTSSKQYSTTSENNHNIQTNPGKHDPVTHKAEAGPSNTLMVKGPNEQELTMKILSTEDKTLAVTRPRKGLKYKLSTYTIPEYVEYNGDIYTVTVIDKAAFKYRNKAFGDYDIINLVLPMTLKEIGEDAFYGKAGLQRIIIPDSVERIGDNAFCYGGFRNKSFEQVHIPKTVKQIGKEAFKYVGPNTSFRGYFQGYLSSIPDYITTGNCTNIGIDEEAVESYERRNK